MNKEQSILTRKNNKGQVWGLDLMMASIIMIVGIIAIYIYAINFSNTSENILEEMFYQGNLVSSLILSEGSPENWTDENMEIPGILSNNKINQTKLNLFYNITNNNSEYKNIKRILVSSYDFYFNFTNMETHGNPISGIGKIPDNPENLVKVERITIYKNKPTKFSIYMWN